jgi:lipopolysaccharide heptosyltransferase I
LTRILVVRLGSLGDLVHTLPAVAALRRAHPTAEIDWLVDAPHRELLTLVPVISSIVTLANRSVGAWLDTRRELRRRRYDVALDFQGLVKSAALARLSGAARVLGFDRRGAREGAAAFLYSERVAGEGGHVIDKNLRLAAAAGARTDVKEFPIGPVSSAALATIRAQVPGAFALLNPGAAWPNKRWPAASFARVARHLGERHGVRSAVLWGPAEEPLARDVVAASEGAAFGAPPTRLADLVAIAREACLMVSGDTGPTHIAAAVGTPVVSMFGPTNPARNGPWNPSDIALSRYEQCACHYARTCRRGAEWCLATITVEDVLAAVDRRTATAFVAARPAPAVG